MTPPLSNSPMAPSEAYSQGVAEGRWQEDPAQRAALAELDRIHDGLVRDTSDGLLQRLTQRFRAPQQVRGLYLWGGVGRGKTFLVDLLFEHIHLPRKRRVHFHRFMGEVQARLAALEGREDPLVEVAADIAVDTRLLCLDEFFVVDIGDAMILARLLEALFERHVVLVTTSNTVPVALYRDGLQRERFLPAIAMLQRHCVVHALTSQTDYRLRALRQAPVYLHPLGEDADAGLQAIWERLSADAVLEAGPLQVNGRPLATRARADGMVWFGFVTLCEGPRAVADYIEIARAYHTVLVADVPQLDATRDDAARRFVHLVDEFYDRNVNLVLSAAVPIDQLYVGERLRGEFERTGSRLIEMQSEAFHARPHRP